MTQLLNKKIISVALTDDHILLRDALAALIENIPGYEVLFIADHGKQMTEHIQKGTVPDIMILDLNMPEMDGYQAAAWLKKFHPGVYILVLTMFDSEIPLIRLLQEGVRGFLKKDIHPDELKTALQSLVKEGYYYPVQTAGRMANLFQVNKQQQRVFETKALSQSDIDFLKLVCTDLTYKEIALELNISPKTIDSLRDTLFQRFDVKSRVGLAIYAVKNGIVNFM
jgi:DNA-binding NarL/FixJ family response regulator